jgi:quinol monooxygenase YgiN
MRSHLLLLAMMALGAGAVHAADPQDPAVTVATYIETLPQAKDAARVALASEAAGCRKDGCRDVHVLQETGRDNHFVVLESWRDRNAFEAHEKAADTQQIRDRLEAIETAPPDERILADVWHDASVSQKPSPDAVWVVTHVDVMPTYKDQTAAMLERLGEGAAKELGHMHFAVTWQPDRPNHFTVMETWADRASFDAHQAAPPTKAFRDKLSPMLGALYDQRIYHAVD